MTDTVFKGVKLTKQQCDYVQKIANLNFEGNFSMALRHLLSELMAAEL